ncbi:PAS domain S-box protein [Terrimonas sp. NA20]|uniref:histidine kinase n=1 Tax=Terrimonas ginsenosidimutans TaxID=2908004 RepID=A0ABS9KUU9_9BACT|nr:PAS domain S-box protein [Terrimonas ginsenosidimutans]MCG2616029.1 PAS domain S-box protein [Terrimonas ginsenosidimutans]
MSFVSNHDKAVKTIRIYKYRVQRGVLLVFIFAALTVALFVKMISDNMAESHNTESLVNHTYEIIKYIENLKSTVAESESMTHGYVATGDSQWRKALTASHAKTIQLLQEARERVRDNTQEKRLSQLQLELQQKMEFQQFLVQHDSITASVKEKIGYYGDERHLSTTINSLFDQFMARQHQLLHQRSDASAEAKNRALATTIIGTALTFIFILGTLWKLNKDILARKVAEEDIRVSEQKHRRLIEDAGVTLFTSDLKGVFSYVSARCFELTGYAVDELAGVSFANLVAADWVERVSDQYRLQVAERRTESDLEFPIITKTGRRKWVEQHAVLLYNEAGQPYGFQCVVKDINSKKEAEEKWRKSEELARTVLDNTREGFFMVNRSYELMILNKKAKNDMEALSGRKVEPGMNLLDFTLKEEQEIAKANLRRVWNGEVVDYESSYIVAGTRTWVRISHSPVRDNNGDIFGAAIVTHDITRAKLSERDAVQADQKVRAMLASTHEGFYMIGPDYMMIMFNEAARSVLRVFSGKDASLGDNILEYVLPERKEAFKDLFNRVMTGESVEVQANIITAEGEKWFHNNYFPVKDENQEVIAVCVSSTDITEKKLAENALEKIRTENEEYQFRLQSILDNTPLIVFIKDLQGRYLLTNHSFREMFNRTDEEVIGQTDFDIDTREQAEHYLELDRQVIETQQSIEREETIYDSERGVRNLLLMKFPLFDKEDKLYGVGGIATDFTERVLNQQKLIEAKKKAETAEQLQEQFLANMSHEIRTPMNGIIGMTNILMGTELAAEQKEFVQIIKQSSDNLLFLINDILDLSKIKSGKLSLEKMPFRISETLDATLAPFQLRAKEKGIRLILSLDPAVPATLLGDPYRLTQILNNLFSNALKFTHRGYIQLTVFPLSVTDKDSELSFSVADTGDGIPDDKLESIFQAFEQASASTTRKFGGTGLGLAITKKLVEMQGGNIMVSSAENEGTVFRFTVKYEIGETDEPVQKIGSEAGADNQKLAGKRILVVEDNEINQKVMQHILQKEKIVPVLAGNGALAVEMLENGESFDLIIMDLSMPEMDGFQTSSYIRQKLKLDTPIIAMTASALRNEKIKCFEVGMNEYLTKPFAPSELFFHLHRFLNPAHENAPAQVTNTITDNKNDSYNLSFLNEMDDSDYFCEVLRIFLETTPVMLDEIKEGLLYENLDMVSKISHKLKSSLGILQMNSMLAMAADIEQHAKAQADTNKISDILKKLTEQFQLVKPMIEAELKTEELRVSGML